MLQVPPNVGPTRATYFTCQEQHNKLRHEIYNIQEYIADVADARASRLVADGSVDSRPNSKLNSVMADE